MFMHAEVLKTTETRVNCLKSTIFGENMNIITWILGSNSPKGVSSIIGSDYMSFNSKRNRSCMYVKDGIEAATSLGQNGTDAGLGNKCFLLVYANSSSSRQTG